MKFYLDTSIYLNIWKKEDDPKTAAPWWQYGSDIIENIGKSKDKLGFYSRAILTELKYLLTETDFLDKKEFIQNLENFKEIIITEKDKEDAKKLLEKHYNSNLSLFDFLHIVLCKKEDAILLTRDNSLIEIAKNYITVGKPEDFLNFI